MVAKVFEKDQIDIYQQAIDAEKCSGNGLAEFICPGFFCSSRIVFGVRYSSHLWYTDYNLYHNVLIKKLEQMVSKYEALKLQRQVYVTGRIKTMNESIYYTVDAIHNAISENKKIKFQYYQWNVKKEMELRHNGAWYHISPWGLSWDDENYYLVGYDSDAGKIKHYRVDKMLHIQMSEEKREGQEYFKKLDMADYAKKSFGMFGGKEQEVKLRVANNLAGVIIDRFGKDVMMIPEDEEHFTVNVDIHVSKQFLGWIFSLGESVRIVGPSEVVAQMKEEIERLVRQYDTVK